MGRYDGRDRNRAGAWHFWGVIGLVRGDYASARKRIERALLLCDTKAGCGYSSQSTANWSESSDWENELTKRHTFSDTTWPILWTGRFTSYEQSGCGCGLSGFETWVPIGAQQDTTSTSTIGRLPSGGLIAPAPLPAAWAFHGYLRSLREVPESPARSARRASAASEHLTPSTGTDRPAS